jgi:predicted outer membrane repeat protein
MKINLRFDKVLIICILLLFLPCLKVKCAIIYVDGSATGLNNGTSWTDAFTDLQPARQVAVPGDDIWVTVGTFYPTQDLSIDSTFNLQDQVDLFGGFLGNETALNQRDPNNRTTLSGNIGDPNDSTDNSNHVCWLSNYFVEMTLDGFVVEGGYAVNSSGGAVYTHEGYITFINCIFRNNYSLYGGAICSTESHMEYIDCVFENNVGIWGGAYQCWGGTDDRFYNCDFIRNISTFYGGAITAQYQTDITLENCRFFGNVAENGGAIVVEQAGKVTCMNNIFDGNQADTGAAFLVRHLSTLVCYNSVIVQNHATQEGGGIALRSGTVNIHNSIFRDNSATIIHDNIAGDTADFNISFSILEDLISGPGNQVANPMFIDPDGPDNMAGNMDDDFHLQLVSPGMNAGDTIMMHHDFFDRNKNGDSTELFPFDLGQNPRIRGANIDIGPFESPVSLGVNEPLNQLMYVGYPYPNPSKTCNLPITLKRGQKVQISLFNAAGQMVEVLFQNNLPAGASTVNLNTKESATGFYLLEVKTANQSIHKKWLIRK